METKEYIRQSNNPGALLNVDYAGLKSYKNKRKMAITIKEQEEKISKLESSLEEVKSLLVKFLETGNNR